MTFGRVNPHSRLEGQGISGLNNVYYNFIEADLISHALQRREGELGQGGAFLVSTGKFTGRPQRQTCGHERQCQRHDLVGKQCANVCGWFRCTLCGFSSSYERQGLFRAGFGGRRRCDGLCQC